MASDTILEVIHVVIHQIEVSNGLRHDLRGHSCSQTPDRSINDLGHDLRCHSCSHTPDRSIL